LGCNKDVILGTLEKTEFEYSEPGYRSRCSDWLRARRPRSRSSSPGRGKIFLLSTSSRPALGSPRLLSNEYRGFFPRGYSGRGVKLTTHLQLVPRPRICGSIHSLPYTSSWRNAQLVEHRENFTFYNLSIWHYISCKRKIRGSDTRTGRSSIPDIGKDCSICHHVQNRGQPAS
jgi:hypothetical protein